MCKIALYSFMFFTLLLACSQKEGTSSNSKVKDQASFMDKVKDLRAQDSLVLPENEKLPIRYLHMEESFLDLIDAELHPDNTLSLAIFEPLKKRDVLKITDNYVLILLKHRLLAEVRAASFSTNGKPIEAILLYKREGNHEYSIVRSYNDSLDINYSYTDSLKEFYFTETRYDTHWIKFPTEGEKIVSYTLSSTVGLSEDGLFYIKQSNH